MTGAAAYGHAACVVRPHRRLTCAVGFVIALIAVLTSPIEAAAQDPPMPPPPRRDTPPVQRDTLPRDTIAGDSLRATQEADTVIPPAVQFPVLPHAQSVDVAGTQWVWDREALLREAHVTLIDLLERIPGITPFRGGMFVQPEAAASFGGTVARTVIEVDGYELDPLAAASLDLSRIALGHLREVRVQRRLGVLRIILATEFPIQGQPYTRVEAGIGVPAANLFRGLFLAPHVIIGPLSLGLERLDTDGTGRGEPAGLFNGWGKWAWTNGERGVQLEWVRGTLRREANSPWVSDRVRQDFILRARNRFSPSLTAEAFAGHASLDETTPAVDDGDPETDDLERRVERTALQAGLRTTLDLPRVTLGATARYRDLGDIGVGDATLEGSTVAGPLHLSGDVTASTWDGLTVAHGGLRAEAGGLFGAQTRRGLSGFGEITRGTRGAPTWDDPLHGDYLLSYRNGWRAGLALDLGWADGAVAYVTMEQDWAWPFGLDFDRSAAPRPLGNARGIEARGRITVWRDQLTLSSWITDWQEAEDWIYLPSRSWRTALELHTLPLPSGNLEIFARAEAHMRGSVLAFDPAAAEGVGGYTRMPARTTADLYLQIRIIDVRAFIRWEDLVGNEFEELPGRMQRGPRIFYGVKWDLWN